MKKKFVFDLELQKKKIRGKWKTKFYRRNLLFFYLGKFTLKE